MVDHKNKTIIVGQREIDDYYEALRTTRLNQVSFKEHVLCLRSDIKTVNCKLILQDVIFPDISQNSEKAADFSDIDFTGGNISFSGNFIVSKLDRANFAGLDISNVKIEAKSFNETNFTRCKIGNITNRSGIYIGTNFSYASFDNKSVLNCNYMIGADFSGAVIDLEFLPCKMFLTLGTNAANTTIDLTKLKANEEVRDFIRKIRNEEKYQEALKKENLLVNEVKQNITASEIAFFVVIVLLSPLILAVMIATLVIGTVVGIIGSPYFIYRALHDDKQHTEKLDPAYKGVSFENTVPGNDMGTQYLATGNGKEPALEMHS